MNYTSWEIFQVLHFVGQIRIGSHFSLILQTRQKPEHTSDGFVDERSAGGGTLLSIHKINIATKSCQRVRSNS